MRNLAMLMCLIAAASSAGCGDPDESCTVPPGVYPDWIRLVGCADDYALLWDERSDSVFAGTATINWIVDREDGDRVYFIDTKEFDLHYYFATAYLDKPGLTPVGTHPEFNILNYRRPNRRFLLGKLVHYLDQDLLTIEMSAGDTADADMIVGAYERVSDAIFDGDALVYRPVSAAQESLLPQIEPRIPVIHTEDVFNNQIYQPLNPGVGFGTLRFARVAELASQPVLPTELVVLDRVPNDISLVSGIVTQEFQTPLSHINILSTNRGTPNMGLRGAFDDASLRAMEGKLVRLEVTPQTFNVRDATPAEAQAYWDSLRPASALVPTFDLSVVAVQSIDAIGASATTTVGAKAANLGEMTNIAESIGVAVRLPETPFAVPFAHYGAHLERNGIRPLIASLLADAALLSPEQLRARLFDIRWRIFRAPLDPDLAITLDAEVRGRWGADRRVRFRSSTNVEDLEEFSGAGLYTSAGAAISDGPDALADAIKVVWASVWNEQAFVEREFYRVDQTRVYMGVLVHPAFVDELANGVAVTINNFARSRPAFYINSQVGEVSVTNPTGQATPEQILYYTWYEDPEYEVITRSSLVADLTGWPGGVSVLTEPELAELATYLQAIHDHFRAVLGGGQSFAMDVEFKLAPGRQIVIKQARPLRVPDPR